MKTKGKSIMEKSFGILEGDVEEVRQRLKKWRDEFSKDSEKRYQLLFKDKRNK